MLGSYPAQDQSDTEESAERQLVFCSGFTNLTVSVCMKKKSVCLSPGNLQWDSMRLRYKYMRLHYLAFPSFDSLASNPFLFSSFCCFLIVSFSSLLAYSLLRSVFLSQIQFLSPCLLPFVFLFALHLYPRSSFILSIILSFHLHFMFISFPPFLFVSFLDPCIFSFFLSFSSFHLFIYLLLIRYSLPCYLLFYFLCPPYFFFFLFTLSFHLNIKFSSCLSFTCIVFSFSLSFVSYSANAFIQLM